MGDSTDATAATKKPRRRDKKRQRGPKQRRVGRVAQLDRGYRKRHDGDFDGGGDGGRAAPSL